VNLSIHPALIVQHLHEEIASEQTVPAVSAVFASAIDMLFAGVSSASCTSSLPTSQVFGRGDQVSGVLPICSNS
jgi:hypothetical protein